MARNGSGVYSLPPGSTVTNGDTSDATDINTPLADIAADLNVARPIVAGGTGASTAANALINFGLTPGATAQATLGLGNAALLAKQTSLTDTTAGSAMLVGAFGIGATALPPTLADIDETGLASGLYGYNSTSTGTFPPGVADFGTIFIQRRDGNSLSLTLLDSNGKGPFVRNQKGGVIGSWRRLVDAPTGLVGGDLLYYSGTDFVRLPKGAAGQSLRMNSGATAPEWKATRFTSTAQTITSAGLLTIAHGLGAAPGFVSYRLKCTTADAGYAIGDEIILDGNGSNASNTRYATPRVDATNIYVRLGNDPSAFGASNKSTGAGVGLTNASWELYVEAML